MELDKKIELLFNKYSDCETNFGLNTTEDRFFEKAISLNAFKKAIKEIIK